MFLGQYPAQKCLPVFRMRIVAVKNENGALNTRTSRRFISEADSKYCPPYVSLIEFV